MRISTNKLTHRRHGNWAVPLISGLLILLSWAVARSSSVELVLAGRWWVDAGEHATGSEAFLLSDALMLAAAVVAGYGIVVKAMRSLSVKHISIDLLVSVAAIGATIIGTSGRLRQSRSSSPSVTRSRRRP